VVELEPFVEFASEVVKTIDSHLMTEETYRGVGSSREASGQSCSCSCSKAQRSEWV